MNGQPVPIVLRGLSTKEPEGLAVAGTLLRLENRYAQKATREGAFQFTKRCGWSPLSKGFTSPGGTTGTISSARKLYVYRDELLLRDSTRLYSRTEGSAQWIDKGASSSFTATTRPVVANGYEQPIVDGCYHQGLAVFAYEDSRGGVRVTAIDYNTGVTTLHDVLLDAAGVLPRVAPAGNNVLVFYITGTFLRVHAISTTSSAVISTASSLSSAVISTGVGAQVFDVQAIGADNVAVAFRSAASTVTLIRTSSAMTVTTINTASITFGAAVSFSWLVQPTFGSSIYLAYIDSTGAAFKTINATTLATTATTAIESGAWLSIVGYFDNSTAICFYDNGGAPNAYIQTNLNLPATTTILRRSVAIASKPFRVDGQWYLLSSYQSVVPGTVIQDSYYLLNASTGQVVMKAISGSNVGGGYYRKRRHIPSVSAVDADTFVMPVIRKTRLESSNNSLYPFFTPLGINMLTVDYNDTALGGSAELGGDLFLPGGFVQMYDGARTREVNFHHAPERPTLAGGTGGSLTPGASYTVYAVFAWVDNAGNTHRSAPSEAATITLTSGQNRIVVTQPTYRLDDTAGIVVELYHSLADGGGDEVYLGTSTSSPTYSTATADSVTINLDLDDTTLGAREPLYTLSGELDNFSPPNARVACVWKNRVWLAGCENPDELWPSKELVAGSGVAWNPGLVIRIDREGGAPLAYVPMGDRLLVVKRGKTYVIDGDGQANDGTGSPFRVSKEDLAVGSDEPDGCASTPLGAMLRTKQGFWLVDRGVTPAYIGAEVEDWNALDVSGAVVREDLSQVWFTSPSGRTQAYDWTLKAWSTHTNHAAVHAVNWRGTFVFVQSDGTVCREVAGQYSDNGTPIPSSIEFDASLGGLEGYVRHRRIVVYGESIGSAMLSITTTLRKDGQDLVEPFSHVTANGDREFVLKPKYRKGSRLIVRIDETTGAGRFDPTAAALVIVQKRGLHRLPGGKTATPL